MKKFTIGTDAEFFLKANGHFISAIPFIGDSEVGTKYNPIRFKDGSTLQRDNVAAEFATYPTDNKKDFVDSIRNSFKHLFDSLPKEVLVCIAPSVIFADCELEHPEAQEFGCDPDFNAWHNGEKNPKPCAINSNLRTAGAHIHVGHNSVKSRGHKHSATAMEVKMKFIRLMDSVNGIASIIFDKSSAAIRRKQLYGKAGAFRPTPYGCEYRVLSNWWLRSPVYARFMFDCVEKCFINFISGYYPNEKSVEAINYNDIKFATHCWFRRDFPFSMYDASLYKPKSLKKEWRI